MSSIEDRVTRLEEIVLGEEKREKDWRETVGTFDDDPFMDEVIDDALRARDDERRVETNADDRESA